MAERHGESWDRKVTHWRSSQSCVSDAWREEIDSVRLGESSELLFLSFSTSLAENSKAGDKLPPAGGSSEIVRVFPQSPFVLIVPLGGVATTVGLLLLPSVGEFGGDDEADFERQSWVGSVRNRECTDVKQAIG